MKIPWIERAQATHRYHVEKLKENPKHRIQDTAKLLKRSLGSVGEDILISKWYKTHPNSLERCEGSKEALRWIRKRQDELNMDVE